MTPEFAEAVDPIFEYAIDLFDRVESGQPVDAERERNRVCALIDNAEAKLGQRPDWQLSKYALACWIDDVLILTNWDGNTTWNEKCCLEEHYFRPPRLRNENFYLRALEASRQSKKDAIEVFYLCVILGFRGLYLDPHPPNTEMLGLPPKLEAWVDQAGQQVKQAPIPPIRASGKIGPGAPPLQGSALLMGSMLAVAIAGAATFILAWMTTLSSH